MSTRIDGQPVLVEHTGVQALETPGDDDSLGSLAAREAPLGRHALPGRRTGPAQLPPRPAVETNVLGAAAMHLGLERGRVRGHVHGAPYFQAAPADQGGQEDDEGGGVATWHTFAIGG